MAVVGFAVVAQTIPLSDTDAPPSLVTSPPRTAFTAPTPVAAVVVTVGVARARGEVAISPPEPTATNCVPVKITELSRFVPRPVVVTCVQACPSGEAITVLFPPTETNLLPVLVKPPTITLETGLVLAVQVEPSGDVKTGTLIAPAATNFPIS